MTLQRYGEFCEPATLLPPFGVIRALFLTCIKDLCSHTLHFCGIFYALWVNCATIYFYYWQEGELYCLNLLSLHKIDCARPSENLFSWRSLALSLHKIGCARPSENLFSWRSLALSLHKIGCARPSENIFSWRSLALSLHKIGCTRPFENLFSWRSLALSLHETYIYIKCHANTHSQHE